MTVSTASVQAMAALRPIRAVPAPNAYPATRVVVVANHEIRSLSLNDIVVSIYTTRVCITVIITNLIKSNLVSVILVVRLSLVVKYLSRWVEELTA